MTERQPAVKRYSVTDWMLGVMQDGIQERITLTGGKLIRVVLASDFERVVKERNQLMRDSQELCEAMEALCQIGSPDEEEHGGDLISLSVPERIRRLFKEKEQERERMVEAIKKLGEIIAPLREVEHE